MSRQIRTARLLGGVATALALLAAAPATGAQATVTVAARHAASSGSGTSSAGVAIAIVAALVAAACVLWALSRALTFEPRWSLSARHSIEEAGMRASAVWAELLDWARLGR